jgi:iron complex transport system permease protein
MGGLADRPLWQVGLATPAILLGGVILLSLGRGLDALSLGEKTARSLGVPVTRTLRLAAIGTAFAAGAGAAVAGSIGFVGLVVPHLLRPWFGERPGALLPAAPLAGAALLLAADMLVRVAPLVLPLSAAPPVGVLTALLGAPFLVAPVCYSGWPHRAPRCQPEGGAGRDGRAVRPKWRGQVDLAAGSRRATAGDRPT